MPQWSSGSRLSQEVRFEGGYFVHQYKELYPFLSDFKTVLTERQYHDSMLVERQELKFLFAS